MIAAKTAAAYRNQLTPILCVGEALRSNASRRRPDIAGRNWIQRYRRFRAPPRDRWSLPTNRSGRSAPRAGVPGVCRQDRVRRFAHHLDSQPDFAGSRVIYGGSAGPGLLTRLKDSVDGLFLGRFAHDPSALEHDTHRSARRRRVDGRRSASHRGEAAMAIGLSTYAFFWRSSERVEHPLTLHDMLEAHPRQRLLSAADLRLHAAGDALARGTGCSRSDRRRARDPARAGHPRHQSRAPAPLSRHRRPIGRDAGAVDAEHRRPHGRPKPKPSSLLAQAVPEYAERGVTLALETYEQVPSAQLVRIVEAVGSETLGICLDPANCVAGLELPTDVVSRTAPYVKNWHVKDFAFTRQAGWVGFTLTGCPLGEGLLDYDSVVRHRRTSCQQHQPDRGALAALARRRRDDLRAGNPMDTTQYQLFKE